MNNWTRITEEVELEEGNNLLAFNKKLYKLFFYEYFNEYFIVSSLSL